MTSSVLPGFVLTCIKTGCWPSAIQSTLTQFCINLICISLIYHTGGKPVFVSCFILLNDISESNCSVSVHATYFPSLCSFHSLLTVFPPMVLIYTEKI